MSSKFADKVNKIRKEVTESFLTTHEDIGSFPTMINIYNSLFFSTEPLGLKELSELTGYSISTICSVMDKLEHAMDVRKFKNPGSKKVYYECLHDTPLLHQKKMQQIRQHMSQLIDVLKNAEEMVEGEDGAEAVKITGYLRERRESYEKFVTMLDSMKCKDINSK